jgi:hypothetical protein
MDPAAPLPAPRRDSLALGVLAAVAYLLLAQQTLYGDAVRLLNDAAAGLGHDKHFAYQPLLAAMRAASEPLGFSLFESARLLSAIGAAIGVGSIHAAFRRLRFTRFAALLATALVAATPSLVFFATVVELHGPFFAFAGLAAWTTARLIERPAASRAIALGAATALAYAAHATAGILPIPLLLAFLAVDSRRARAVRLAALALGVHAALIVAALLALRLLGAETSAGAQLHQILEFGAHFLQRPIDVLHSAWLDWLAPCAPLSVAWLAGFAHRELRPLATALLVALLPYVAMTFVLCGPNPEHGAYQLPLLWPAAWITVRALPRGVAAALLVVAAALAVGKVKAHDDPERSAQFAAGLRELAGESEFVVLAGDLRDHEAMYVRFPGHAFVYLPPYVNTPPARWQQTLDALAVHVERELAAGKRVFQTSELEALLTHPVARQTFPFGARMLEFLAERFRAVPVQAQGFAGKEITAR